MRHGFGGFKEKYKISGYVSCVANLCRLLFPGIVVICLVLYPFVIYLLDISIITILFLSILKMFSNLTVKTVFKHEPTFLKKEKKYTDEEL